MSRRRQYQLACLMIVAVLCAVIAGCSRSSSPYNHPIEGKLNELNQVDQSAPLGVLTDFDWDTFHFFEHPTGQEAIDAVLGPGRVEDYKSADSTPKDLMVFEKDGEVVERIPVVGMLSTDRITWPRNVVVVPDKAGLRLAVPPK